MSRGFTAQLMTIVSIVLLCLYFFEPGITQSRVDMAVMARENLYDHWDFEKAADYFDRIIGKRYTPAFAYSDYGWYLWLIGEYDKGLEYIERAAKMDPKDKQLLAWNAWAKLWDGDLNGANEWIRKSLKVDSKYGEALHIKSMIASAEGKHDEAIRLAEQAAANDPNWRGVIPLALIKAGRKEEALSVAQKIEEDLNAFDTMLLMEAYSAMGNREKALDNLEKGFELRHPFMPWLKFVPGTEYLHDDPRFQSVAKKMKLPM
jgi:tetratricopeptide (TPR) repeat protein